MDDSPTAPLAATLETERLLLRPISSEAIHHERTAIGKNATDIALVVDAMDLLHRRVLLAKSGM